MTAQAIGSLFVQAGFDTAHFDAGVERLRAGAKAVGKLNFGQGIKDGLSEVDAWMKSTAGQAGALGSALSGMGLLGAAAGAAIVAGFAGARQAMAFGDDIADTANKLSVTTDYLQEMRFVAHDLGGDFRDADAALEGFTTKFGAARAKLTKKATKPFEALGLDAASFESTQEALDAVIKKIAGLASTAEQAAIADKLGLTPMLPAIREGSAAIDDMRQKARDLGYVMDAQLVEKAGDANDKFEDLQQVIAVQLNSALVELAPLVLSVTGAFADGAKDARELSENLSDVASGYDALIDKAPQAAKEIIAAFKAVWAGHPMNIARRMSQSWFGGVVDAGRRAGLVSDHHNLMNGGRLSQDSWQDADLLRGPPKPPEVKTGTLDGGGSASAGKKQKARPADGSQAAIEAAERAEVAARVALTGSIEKLAELKLKQIESDLATIQRQIKQDVDEGKITKAAGDRIAIENEKAASSKRELLHRQTAEQIAQRDLEVREGLLRYQDDISSAEAAAATTAKERNRIELEALDRRQAFEAAKLAADLKAQVDAGEIDAYDAQSRQLAQAVAASVARTARIREGQEDVAREQLAATQEDLQLRIDDLSIQHGMAETAQERRQIALQILELEQQLERARLNEIVGSSKSSAADVVAAKARLAQLPRIEAAQRKQIEASDGLVTSYRDTASAVQDAATAFENGDFVGMVTGVQKAVANLKVAFGKAATIGDKVAAMAGVAGAVGNMVGGTAGSALGGAASGAMAGFTLGGPIGAAIGGILGGVSSLFGSSSAKKKAKAEAEARAREAEAQRQAAIQQRGRELEIQILRESGDEIAAVAAERAAEKAATDASLHPQLERLWAIQDEAKAATKAAEAAEALAAKQARIESDRTQLRIDMLEAQGRTEEAVALKRSEHLKSLEESLRAEQMAVWAQQDLKSAAEASARAVQEAAEIAERAAAAEAEAARKKADEDEAELQRLLAIQKSERDIVRQLMAMDDAVLDTRSAELAQREEELATLSPTAQALQKLLWARQDEQREIDENRVKAEAAAAYAKSRRELEIRLMEVSGDAAGARSARLADERDATVEGLRPLLDLINAQEKLNEENEKAAALLSQRKGLESQLLDLIDAVGAKARSNAAAIQALDPSLRPLQAAYDDLAAANEAMAKAEQDAADARDKLTDAYEREKSQLTSLIDKWRSVAEGFKTFSQQLQLGAIAGNSPTEQYAKAKADFERVARLVGEKDEKALGELQDVSERFLDASEDAQTENIVYLRDLAAVKAATRAAEAYAKDQVDTAERQLAALDASVSGLLAVNSSVISVRDAIGGLAASMSSRAAATAARDAARDAALQTLQNTGAGKTKTPVAINDNDSADLKAAKAIYLSANGGIATDVWDRLVGASSSAWTATFSRVGYEGDPEALRAKWKFADGGAFTNGVVHRPTMFDAALMGEAGPEGILPLANGPNGLGVYAYGGQRAGADPGVGQALAAQGQQLDRIVQATERSAKILTQVSRDGDGLVIAA